MDVADPAEGTTTTPDSEIKTDLVAALNGHKPKMKGKESQIKNVTVIP
jgi:hypothetical protein